VPVHSIRLLGPWQVAWQSPRPSGAVPLPAVVVLPFDWQQAFGSVAGTVRLVRRFHRPTNLEPHEQVWLAFQGVGGRGDVCLNGEWLGALAGETTAARFEITRLLKPFNELTVELQFDPAGNSCRGGIYDVVTLTMTTDHGFGPT